MRHQTRGRAIIINNVKFRAPLSDREGSGKDATRLESVLTQLHFTATVENDKTSEVTVYCIVVSLIVLVPTS